MIKVNMEKKYFVCKHNNTYNKTISMKNLTVEIIIIRKRTRPGRKYAHNSTLKVKVVQQKLVKEYSSSYA